MDLFDTVIESLLKVIAEAVTIERYLHSLVKSAEVILDTTIRLVAGRRQRLKESIRASLDAQPARGLRPFPGSVLDYRAFLAIPMLREEMLDPAPFSLVVIVV